MDALRDAALSLTVLVGVPLVAWGVSATVDKAEQKVLGFFRRNDDDVV